MFPFFSEGKVGAGGNRRDSGQPAGHPAENHLGDHQSPSAIRLVHSAAVPGRHCTVTERTARGGAGLSVGRFGRRGGCCCKDLGSVLCAPLPWEASGPCPGVGCGDPSCPARLCTGVSEGRRSSRVAVWFYILPSPVGG